MASDIATRLFSKPMVSNLGFTGSSLRWASHNRTIRSAYAATTASAGDRRTDASLRFVRTEDISADTSSARHFLSIKPSSRAAGIQSQQAAFWLHFALFNMIGGIDTSAASLRLVNWDVPSLLRVIPTSGRGDFMAVSPSGFGVNKKSPRPFASHGP